MKGIIYLLTNTMNGKKYIGQTCQRIRQRYWEHKRDAIERNSKTMIGKAIRKYGIEVFKIEIIDSFESDDLAQLKNYLNMSEAIYIKAFNTLKPNGYNIRSSATGAEGLIGVKRPEHVIEAIKESWDEQRREYYSELFKDKERTKGDVKKMKLGWSKKNAGKYWVMFPGSNEKVIIDCSLNEFCRRNGLKEYYAKQQLRRKTTNIKEFRFGRV